MFLAVLILGFFAGLLSGLLGVGGGIIIIPAFLFVLPLFGFAPLPLKEITGIAATQVLVGSFFAYREHKKFGLIRKEILYEIGLSSAIGSFIGSVASKFMPSKILLIIYLLILILSITALLRGKQLNVGVKHNNSKPGVILSFVIGLLSGALGLGGAVLLIPLLGYLYKMELKESISNVTVLVFITAIASFAGKALTFQIPVNLILFIIVGAFVGAKLGAKISRKISQNALKQVLLIIIFITALRVVISIAN